MENIKDIEVYASWFEKEKKIGTLHTIHQRAIEKYSFEFDDLWLRDNSNFLIDPDLFNGKGRQFTPIDKKIFGFLSDCAPDRWGRTLLKRKESTLAKREQRPKKALTELDFILGVNDESRIGGLRFKYDGEEEFLSKNDSMSIPPLENIRTLETASIEYEKNENPYETKWLQILLSPGSSLGGARPKATVKDVDGSLWVAKFPSIKDEWNMGAWEYVANRLAVMCGLNTAETKALRFSNKGTTFLSKRFDRIYSTIPNELPKRIHYASAMTLLGKTDGASAADGTSYLDIADFIKSNSIQPNKDLEELWNRIFFNVAISNTDDHLRNHGFLLTEKGWTLSPLFDINPNPYGVRLALNIGYDEDDVMSKQSVLDNAIYYGLSEEKAKLNAERISQTVNDNWQKLAKQTGISNSEINIMKEAFNSSEY